ncbi:MAG: YbhB/YbcL family Raf kinase inhibitor-like protein [Deltaproteobacteria bacterium]|nr:YbhB/YbcL family Raf kinase inhibitor-like protein [Nannocystaceae bacterium]
MSIRRLSLITSLLLVACPSDDDGETGAGTGTDPSSSTAPSTTEPGESSTLGTTEGSSSSTNPSGSDSSSGGAEESSTAAVDESSSTGEPVAFTLTSTAFAEGDGIPGIHHVSGGNQSPPLDWVGAPAGTMSYAVFFHDLTIDFEHSAIWNIPVELTGLPQDVDHDAMPADVPGAVQCDNWTPGTEYGYGGPGSASNTYEFILYAIDVETLTEIGSDSTLLEVFAELEAHSIGTATLTGQSTGPGK